MHFAASAAWAPVTGRCGKSMIVTRRLATHNRLRDAAYWARVGAQRGPVSRGKYWSLRTLVAQRACALSRMPPPVLLLPPYLVGICRFTVPNRRPITSNIG